MVRIRTASSGDEGRLALVAGATFLETFAGILAGADIVAHCENQHSALAYSRWLSDRSAQLWLAETSGGAAPVGYALMASPDLPLADVSAADVELKRIYLLQRFHGLGVGQMLMQVATTEAKARGARRLLLGVYASNHRALAFYYRSGFVKVGDRQFEVGGNRYADTMLALDLSMPPT